jgi:hypothetical protein
MLNGRNFYLVTSCGGRLLLFILLGFDEQTAADGDEEPGRAPAERSAV